MSWKKETTSGKIFDIFNIVFQIFTIAITFYPFWYLFILSITSVMKVSTSEIVFLPKFVTFEAYSMVFKDNTLFTGYVVSASRVICGVLFSIFVNCMAAYALSRPYFVIRKQISTLMIITMYVGGGMIPFYLVVHTLQLTNTFFALFVPFAYDAFAIIIMRSYFKTIPVSLDDSAKIDGAGDLRIFLRIYFPLSLPIIATMSLFWAVALWNDFIWAQFLVYKQELVPVQAILYKILVQSANTAAMSAARRMNPRIGINLESIKAAAVIVTTVPILVVYPFLQKYFIQGMTLGAIKE